MTRNGIYSILALAVLLLSIVPVGTAVFLLGFINGDSPCVMCWEQRTGMVLVALTGLFVLRYGPRPKYLGLSVLLGAWGVFMGLRHTGMHAARDVGQGFSLEILGAHTYTWALFIFWVCTVTMGVLLMLLMIFPPALLTMRQHWFLMFALATPVQFWAGWQFYRGAWMSARHRTTDMNTLIAVGTSAAYLYSTAVTFLPGFFEGAAGAGFCAGSASDSGLSCRPRRRGWSATAWRRTCPWKTCCPAMWCWSAPVRRSPWTASSWMAAPLLTSPCSPANRSPWRKGRRPR